MIPENSIMLQYKIIDGFLTPEICDQIVQVANVRFRPSTSWNVNDGKAEVSDFRISDTMFFFAGENELIRYIEQTIANITETPVENGEGIQVVRYNPGGQFKPHWDAFDPVYGGNQAMLQSGGQRVHTFIMYLNDCDAETYFPKVDIAVKPVKGRGLLFKNVDDEGKIELESYHEGRPVAPGQQKYIATRWIRERIYQAVPYAQAY